MAKGPNTTHVFTKISRLIAWSRWVTEVLTMLSSFCTKSGSKRTLSVPCWSETDDASCPLPLPTAEAVHPDWVLEIELMGSCPLDLNGMVRWAFLSAVNGVGISSEVLALPVHHSFEVTGPSHPCNTLSRELLGPSLIDTKGDSPASCHTRLYCPCVTLNLNPRNDWAGRNSVSVGLPLDFHWTSAGFLMDWGRNQ